MSQPSLTHKYKQTSVTTANRGHLLLMLYEAAIINVKKALEAINKKDLKAKSHHIGKAHDIINELQNTLDFKVGGQIAIDLDRLYSYMTEQLLHANLHHSTEALGVILTILNNLLSGWKVAVEQANRSSTGKSEQT